MDFHHVLAQHYGDSLRGLTAFSALPDAPVLGDEPSRLRTAIAAVRARATSFSTVTRPTRRPAHRTA
jgi:hypothetical protein